MWERIGNRALEDAGLDIRIDCRSFADQGIDREATVHLGPVASGMERNGERPISATATGRRRRATPSASASRATGQAVSAEIIDLAAERSAARSGAGIARGDPDAQPAEDPRRADRAALDLQPRRSQPGAWPR